MDCLILGGYGFLGSRIVDYLKKKGNITIGSSQIKINNFGYKSIIEYRELTDIELDQLTKNFELIIDASGISGQEINKSDIDYILKLNSLWPIRLSKSCIKNKCNLIIFSSFHCENISINDPVSLQEQIYPISKILAEIAIKNFKKWNNNVSIIRLGNMIGSPGTIYMGRSNLLPLDISQNLATKGTATINSNPAKEIGYVPISKLLDTYINFEPGFHKLYSKDKISIFRLSKQINSCYEKKTGLKGNLIFKHNHSDLKEYPISKEILLEIESMVDYFLNLKIAKNNFKNAFNK